MKKIILCFALLGLLTTVGMGARADQPKPLDPFERTVN